jgi:hypothetical protein
MLLAAIEKTLLVGLHTSGAWWVIELRHLRYFVVVGGRRPYGRSGKIREHQNSFGDQLLERSVRDAKFAAATKLSLDRASLVLHQVRAPAKPHGSCPIALRSLAFSPGRSRSAGLRIPGGFGDSLRFSRMPVLR